MHRVGRWICHHWVILPLSLNNFSMSPSQVIPFPRNCVITSLMRCFIINWPSSSLTHANIDKRNDLSPSSSTTVHRLCVNWGIVATREMLFPPQQMTWIVSIRYFQCVLAKPPSRVGPSSCMHTLIPPFVHLVPTAWSVLSYSLPSKSCLSFKDHLAEVRILTSLCYIFSMSSKHHPLLSS